MKRILVLLENDMYVRNFLTSGALDELLARGDVGLAASERVTKLLDAVPVEHLVGRYTLHARNIRRVYIGNRLSMLAQRDRSATFAIKTEMEWLGAYTENDRAFVREYGMPGIRHAFLAKLEPNATLKAIIERERPELVIAPFAGVEATPAELMCLSTTCGFRTLLLANGWDNLSSEGVFVTQPDAIGVVGPQSAVDAVEIQGMAPDRVLLMGCARYEPYFRAKEPLSPAIEKSYALFAGCSLECDELTPLRHIDDVIERTGSRLHVVYRPHPWRAPRSCDDVFRAEEFRHVVLDPQVEESHYESKQRGIESVSNESYPALSYYPELLRGASFIVSTVSSLILEAGIFNVPSLLLAHDDGVHSISPSHIARFRHFEGADDVPGWHRVDALEQIPAAFEDMMERYAPSETSAERPVPSIRPAIRHFLYWDERTYGQRVRDATETLLSRFKPGTTPDRDERPEELAS